MWNVIKNLINPPSEWDKAKQWASESHPGWVYLAAQKTRPELCETYRLKIIDSYNRLQATLSLDTKNNR